MIGIFDSGSGGLTVLKAIYERFPSADVLYFGDIKNAPYGSRSREELSKLTVDALSLLLNSGARNIVSACNSVSASLAISLMDTVVNPPENLIEMVGPTVRYFRGTKARLALCATPATIDSGIYQNAFAMIGVPIECFAIEGLAAAIEFDEAAVKIQSIISAAIPRGLADRADGLILACTHYPLVLDSFNSVLENKLHIFDPAIAVAERVEELLWPREMSDGRYRFLISQDSEPFRALVARLFPEVEYSIEVLE
jgi:glutamate racemase